MSYNKNAIGPPQIYSLGPSVYQLVLIISAHSTALVACWLNGLSEFNRLFLIFLVLLSLITQLWVYNENNIICLGYGEPNGWEMVLPGGQSKHFEIGKASVITKWVIVLYCRMEPKQRVIVIFNDALPARKYRTLLATLRITSAL